jgi:hypothetical protein
MTSFIRKHWGNLVFALASFFWTGCGSGEISTADDVDCSFDGSMPIYGVEEVSKCPTPNRDNYKEESSNSAVSSSSEEKHSR